MEYQGIITGIGDKDLGKNLIQPEYDAVINDFIIGKNTILEGLVLNGKNLSAGACVLCGYRGIIEENKTLDTVAYVYGEFTLNSIYGGSGEDDFNIVTSNQLLGGNVNPSQITSAGIYYLLLYVNGVKQVDNYKYPKNSQYSVETENVLSGAVIAPTATTPTETKTITNELGEEETVIVTDLHLPNAHPKRVANTEYVHAQIEREVDYDDTVVNFVSSNGSVIGSLELKRKSKYVIGVATINDASLGGGNLTHSIWGVIPEKFRPEQPFYFCMNTYITNLSNPMFREFKCETNGNIIPTGVYGENASYDAKSSVIGYQCQYKENNNA